MPLQQKIRRVAGDVAPSRDRWQRAMRQLARCRDVTDLVALVRDVACEDLGYHTARVLLLDSSRHVLCDPVDPACVVSLRDNIALAHLLADARLRVDGPGFLAVASDLLGLPGSEARQETDMLCVALHAAATLIGVIVATPGSPAATATHADALVALSSAVAPALDKARGGQPVSTPPVEARRRVVARQISLSVGHDSVVPLHGADAMLATDALTGLPSHRAMLERLDRLVEASASFTLLLVDIDNFALFNETHGHEAGDRVLREAAAILRAACRSDDIIGRFGHDEFALVLPGVTAMQARAVLRRIEGMVRSHPHIAADRALIPLSISAGLAVYPTDGLARRQLVAIAADRLHTAKHGRGPLRRTVLSRDLQGDSRVGVLMGLVTAVDSKDRYTREHSEDVTRWALLLADQLGLGRAERRALAVAGPLHDIGKIGVPDRILRKPGKLTRDEYETMKHHVPFGVAIIGGVLNDPSVIDAVAHHHERWDGHGYPHGRMGTQVPLLGRIMQIADAVSAMRQNRPYRQGLPWSYIEMELRRGAGYQFDPELIAAFIAADPARRDQRRA